MTAFTTCPFFTFDSGVASFTEAVTMSPSLAYRPVDPPIGLMTAILRAPELSATSRIDRIWIMTLSPGPGDAVRGARHSHLNHRRLANDADERPAFPTAHRARFDDGDGI